MGAPLGEQLRAAAEALLATVARVPAEHWSTVARPGEWSIGKDVEHVAEGNAYHQWIVRLSLGERVGSQRPRIARAQLVSSLAPDAASALIRERTAQSLRLIEPLSSAQLALPTQPPRPKAFTLGQMIAAVLIGHYGKHRADVEAKLQALAARGA